MAKKRPNQRGVIQVASSVVLAAIGVMLSLTGCSTDDGAGERLASVSQGVVSCGTTICGTGLNDCNTWTCGPLNTCVLGKAQKNPGDACTAVGKLVNPPGRCATDATTKDFVCCTGCVDQPLRGEFVCHAFAEEDLKTCGSAGADCAPCAPTLCGDPLACAKGACTYTPVANDTKCSDGSGVCYNGTCCAGCIDAQGNCLAGTAVDACGKSIAGDKHADCQTCVDGDVCTTDICKEGTCAHGSSPDNTSCKDTNNCDGAETCQGGVCKEPAGFVCPTDNNVCHAPTCDATMNCGQKLLTGNACPDANLCNGTETCQNGACTGLGTPKNCDDKNPCTLDDCDPKTGACINTPQGGASCDDGNLCNGIGICDAGGACVVNPSPSCDDGEICTTDSCDPTPVTGGCKHANNTVVCTDADPCTVGDKCGGGKCVGGAQAKCDDGNACTADSCKAGTGCQFAPLTDTPCNDGNDCSTGDHCEAGACKATGGTICAVPSNSCKTSKCDGSTGGQCVVVDDDTAKCRTDLCHDFSQCSGGVCPVGTPVSCDDGNPCTTDGCEPATGCTHVADDAATCPDADLCTETACKRGKCVAIDSQCEAFDDCHIAGTCNPKSGFCDSPPAPSGTDCDSGNGKCDTKGKCIPNPPGGEGGAGGEGTGGVAAGGDGTAGSLTEGGAPPVAGTGGAGHEPTAGGEPSTEPTAGKAGSKATGGSTTTEGGAPEEDVHVFVRSPGGCSCTVPQAPPSGLQWLGGLALIGALARRRRTRLDATAQKGRVS